MDDHGWGELIEFIIDRTSISEKRVERILNIYTPEALPPSLLEVIQDILSEKEVTREGVSPLTKYGALSSLMDLEAEQTKKEFLNIETVLGHGRVSEAAVREVPELFIEYSNLIEDICSKTGENEETIHQVHRAYLEYVYMKTNNPDTLIPFLKWYLKTEENINRDL